MQVDITIDHVEGSVPVTVLGIHGDMDGSNFQMLIDKGREVSAAGAKHFIIDMSDMPFMSSAGLVALHNIARLAQGKEPTDPEAGWAALRAVGKDRDAGSQQQVRLVNPQPPVDRVLESTGMKQFFEVYSDLETAVGSF
jgi:anti-anti-sigma factor